jgi:hypothetical protein
VLLSLTRFCFCWLGFAFGQGHGGCVCSGFSRWHRDVQWVQQWWEQRLLHTIVQQIQHATVLRQRPSSGL